MERKIGYICVYRDVYRSECITHDWLLSVKIQGQDLVGSLQLPENDLKKVSSAQQQQLQKLLITYH